MQILAARWSALSPMKRQVRLIPHCKLGKRPLLPCPSPNLPYSAMFPQRLVHAKNTSMTLGMMIRHANISMRLLEKSYTALLRAATIRSTIQHSYALCLTVTVFPSGVFREMLIAKKRIKEKIITKEELAQANNIWFINSVRGAIAVKCGE